MCRSTTKLFQKVLWGKEGVLVGRIETPFIHILLKIPNQKVQIEFSTKKVELDQKPFGTFDLLGHDMFVYSQRCFLTLTILNPNSYLGVELHLYLDSNWLYSV